MSTNPLKSKPVADGFRNPLTDAKVAREWSAWARADGKGELSKLWADHAWKLENPQSRIEGPATHRMLPSADR